MPNPEDAIRSALAWLDSLQASGIRPGLRRMRALLRALGRPERACPAVIVAGTNGKGSTAATLASIFHAGGLKTGFYTSPHLVDIRERWSLGGVPIAGAALTRAIVLLRVASEGSGIVPTYFEALTLLAFIAFRDAACDVAVLEVGMGGRMDATNVVRPLAALITLIGMDHTEFLGNSIRKIAAEKAGVIHRGAIVLTSNRDPQVLEVLRRRAANFDCPFIIVEVDHDTPLAGAFQRRNAALAVRAAEELTPRFPSLTGAVIERGVRTTRWRGRLERFEKGGKEIWVDGGHNAHAVTAIAPFIETTLRRPRLLVFGIMSDKDVEDVVRTLIPLFDSVVTTEPYPPRSMNAGTLAAMVRRLGVEAFAAPEPRHALQHALDSPYETILVAGSLYLAGAAIEFLDAMNQAPS